MKAKQVVKVSAHDISIDGLTNVLYDAVAKDWAHRKIEEGVRPAVSMESWLKSRIAALYRELQRNEVRVIDYKSTTAEAYRYGRRVTTNALLVHMMRGPLPLVGILKYDAKNWFHFDGKMIFQVAVPVKGFHWDQGKHDVHVCSEAGGTTQLSWIGARDAALFATFGRERMKVTNRIAVALVHSIGKV